MAKKKVGIPANPPQTGGFPVVKVDRQEKPKNRLTKLEKIARREMSQSIRVAAFGGDFGNAGGGAISNADSAFYSPQLSTDFLELPQSEREKHELFRFWYTCFPPGAPVLLADGTTRPIEKIQVGDRLPNGLGEITTVKELFQNDIEDDIVEMSVWGIQGLISATGNHPFLVYRSEQVACKYTDASGICKQGANAICRRTKCHELDFGEPQFIYAKDLRIGDYIVAPPIRQVKSSDLDRARMRLLGYYASEGSPAYRSAGVHRGVEFTLNIDEASTIAVEISDLFLAIYGKPARIYTDSKRNTTRVVCDSLDFLKLCIDHVGTGSHSKKLSESIVCAPLELALEFLGAYWNGDGCFTDNSYTADSVSSDMASQIFQIARRAGFPAYHSKYYRPARITQDGNKYPEGTIHYVSFPGRFQAQFGKYANHVDGSYDAKTTRSYLTNSNFGFLHRIESLRKVPYKGTVYNFEVNGDGDRKSYIAHGLATHNTHPIVGSAIDFHCFPAGAPVQMRDGTVCPIESLSIGDEVRNGFGEPTKVVNTFKHHINGVATRLKVRGVQSTIDCTQNHPFLIYRAEQVDCQFTAAGMGACKSGIKSLCSQKKCGGKDFGSPQFVFAHELKEGDYICSPSISDSKSAFNRSQLRLLGYYAAEGSLSRTGYGALDRVVFTLNSDELDTIANEISEEFSKLCDADARIRMRTDSNSCDVRCYKKDFAEFCYKHVGSGSRSKRLSLDIMESPREDVLEFLGAYWNGDGSLTKNGYVATTTSEQMAHQIYALALKVGYIPTLHKTQPQKCSTGFKSNGPTYRIIIPYRFHPEFSKYANYVGGGYSANSTREYVIRVGQYTLRRIESVKTVPFEGMVYNIEVDGEGDRKSYVAFGLSTHNTDVPMSKIRLSLPKGKDVRRNKQILHYYQKMAQRTRLFQTLYDATHEYWLNGNVYLFCEDHDLTDQVPENLLIDETEEEVGEVDYAGRSQIKKEKKKTLKPADQRAKAIHDFVRENYQGWQRLQILPPEQVKLEVFQYTNKVKMELIPSEKDRMAVLKAQEQNDPDAARIAEDIPADIRENLLNGQPIPLNTSPYDNFLCSSFCYHLAHKKAAYDERGISLLERCLRTLLYQDKLRQAQTSIASRAMTPKRIVWADKMSEPDTDNLRDQIDQALIDPDFTIVTNFEVHWDEIGSRDRLLDLGTEYDVTNRLLYIGLRVTESMLTGESTYSGERIHLDVMNTMYLLYRETIADFVEQNLFAPVAEKMGFYEEDEWGNRILLHPKLQFTRLALRDNTELQDFMFNLYQKGSLPISFILELINIDSDDALEQLKADMFTPNDSTFNELLRTVLSAAGDKLVEEGGTNLLERLAKAMGLDYKPKDGDRFGKDSDSE